MPEVIPYLSTNHTWLELKWQERVVSAPNSTPPSYSIEYVEGLQLPTYMYTYVLQYENNAFGYGRHQFSNCLLHYYNIYMLGRSCSERTVTSKFCFNVMSNIFYYLLRFYSMTGEKSFPPPSRESCLGNCFATRSSEILLVILNIYPFYYRQSLCVHSSRKII